MNLAITLLTQLSTMQIHCNFLCSVENDTIAEFMEKFNFQFWTDPKIWPDFCGDVSNLFLIGMVSIVILLIIVGFVLLDYAIATRFNFFQFLRRLKIRYFFVASWTLGFLVYDIGMCTGNVLSLIGNAPMAIVHAFGMFVFSSDVSEIHSVFFNNWLFMTFFSLAHASAAAVSAMFVIKHFGFNIKSRFKIWRATHRDPKDDTYVLWGINPQSIRLVESINDHYKAENNKGYRIILVKTNNEADDAPESITGFNRIFEFLSLKNAELEQLSQLDCLITTTYINLNTIKITEDGDKIDILGDKLKLRDLKKLLDRKHTTGEIHFLFLSDDEAQNLHDVSIMLNDITLNGDENSSNVKLQTSVDNSLERDPANDEISQCEISTVVGQTESISRRPTPDNSLNQEECQQEELIIESDEGVIEKSVETGFFYEAKRVTFYCHARNDSIHRILQDNDENPLSRIKLVDSSLNSLNLLKMTTEVMPVNFVKVEKNGTVSSPFNALVVGFSEVGYESVKFLYEFGAFVKHKSKSGKVERSEFHLDVVDIAMASKAGYFASTTPSIKLSIPFCSDINDTDSLITLHDMDCKGVEFARLLDKICKGLNYVVLATENDELNISMAIRILTQIIRVRGNVDNLCILVRIQKDEDGHFHKIASRYNKLWSAQMATGGLDATRNEVFKRTDSAQFPIYLFGNEKDNYTYDIIINDSLLQKAREYKELYCMAADENYKLNAENRKTSKDGKKRLYVWDDEEKVLLHYTKELKDYHPTYSGIEKLRRNQQQDIANANHLATKRKLCEEALKACKEENDKIEENPDWTSYNRYLNTITYFKKDGSAVADEIQNLLDVLAQTEHLRWNASHELLGFVKGRVKSETKRVHPSLTEWEELDEGTKSYDYNVVDISLGILTEEKTIEDNPDNKQQKDQVNKIELNTRP